LILILREEEIEIKKRVSPPVIMARKKNNRENKRGKNNKCNQQSVGTTNSVAVATASKTASGANGRICFLQHQVNILYSWRELTDEGHYFAAQPIFKQGSELG
jgi:hypothetical protein